MRTHAHRTASPATAKLDATEAMGERQFLQRSVGNLQMAELLSEAAEEEELAGLEDETDAIVADPDPWRKKPHRSKKFEGRTWIFGGKRGKYLKNWIWTWGRGKTQQGPATTTTRTASLTAQAIEAIPITGDSNITAHGAAFYAGQPIAGTTPLDGFTQQVAVSVTPPAPSLGANETATLLAGATQMTAALTYRVGDTDDPGRPRAQFIVDVLGPGMSWTPIFTTAWTNTNGQWQTVPLPAGILVPNANYRVRVIVEWWNLNGLTGYQWGDGRAQVDYSLGITQIEQRTFAITKTTAGKKTQVKKPKSFRLRF